MRKGKAKKRILLPDPKFNEIIITRFVNNLMYEGKKSLSYAIFYETLEILAKKNTDLTSVELFKKALENVTPQVEVKSRRVGGATFQIPQEIRADRKTSLAIKWLILYARKRNERSMSEKLAAEILAAFKGEGATHKKKEDTHRMAEANKAFSHFRF